MNYALIVEIAVAALSALGSLLFLGYLLHTLARAPRFSESLKELEIGKKKKFTSNARQVPAVSIIVTAKNEERFIGRNLESLCSQVYPDLEIVVVDDSSRDRTKELALEFSSRDSRVRVLAADEKPPGWVGKSWACWRGNEFAKGDLLLFMDADSVFERNDAVESVVKYFEAMGYDMFSISPRVNSGSIWSSSTLPIVSGAIDVLYPLSKVNDPSSERAYVFGTFILVRKKVYVAIGGHKAVRDRLVEDQAIAQRAKLSGYSLRVENGSGYLATDWEEEFSKIYSGLERVTSTSIRSYGLVSILNAFLLFFLAIYPILFLAWGVCSVMLFPIADAFEIGAGIIASLVAMCSMLALAATELRRVVGRVGALPMLYPVGMLIFIAAIVTTTVKVAMGRGLEWKGALYRQARIEQMGKKRAAGPLLERHSTQSCSVSTRNS